MVIDARPDRARLGGVRVEQLGQQVDGHPGLGHQREARARGRGLTGSAGAAVGGAHPPEAFGDVFDGDDDLWAELIGFNLLSMVRVTRAALPALTASRGSVVNISADVARRPIGVPLPYATAKAGIDLMSRGLAGKLAPTGVRVSVVSPSGMRTEMWENPDGYVARLAAHLGVDHATLREHAPGRGGMLTGRLIEPDEVARAVLLLASPTMPSAIGENWAVDAGSIKAV